jgi:MFS family permease
MGDQHVHLDLRRFHPPGWPRRRPDRAQASVRCRDRPVLRSVAGERPRAIIQHALLIAGRGLQGLGGALLAPAVLSIITTTFSDAKDRAKALAIWSAIAAGGGAVGLLLGGVLTDLASWRWIFFVNVPVGAALAAATVRFVPESRSEQTGRTFDLPGAASVTAGLVVLVFAIVKSNSYGWGSPRTIGLLAAGLVLLAAFLVIERGSPAPLMPLSIFRRRSLAAADLTLLLTSAAVFATFFFVSLYLQQILGYSPLSAGVSFLPLSAGIATGATVARKRVARDRGGGRDARAGPGGVA